MGNACGKNQHEDLDHLNITSLPKKKDIAAFMGAKNTDQNDTADPTGQPVESQEQNHDQVLEN